MLAGLLHGVGELYILTRAQHHAKLFQNDAAYRAVIRDWHASVAKAMLRTGNRRISSTPSATSSTSTASTRPAGHHGRADGGLPARRLSRASESLELNMNDVTVCRRLGLGLKDYEMLIRESRDEVNALRDVLDS